MDYIVKTGTILEAVDNQPWSGEANVHVSIANWAKSRKAELFPGKRRLWYKLLSPSEGKKLRRRGNGPAAKEYELTYRECERINSALSDQADMSVAKVLTCNQDPQRIFRGLEPGNMGFLLTHSEAHSLIAKDTKSAAVVKPYLTGRELLTGDGTPERWLIDFQRLTIIQATEFNAAFEHVKRTVLPQMQRIEEVTVQKDSDKDEPLDQRIEKRQLVARLDTWWQLRRCVPNTVQAIEKLPRYVVCSLVTKRPIFVFLSKDVRPSNLVQSFAFADDYSFGILQSNAHWQWFVAKCSKLTERFRYTPESVFDTFPWPQSPTVKQINAVAEAGREVRRLRAEALSKIKGGLRAVYRTLELPGQNPLKDAHAALDAAVLDAYGFSPKKDLLAQLLALNLEVAERIEKGEAATAPGVPTNYPDAAKLVTVDCIKP